MREVRARNHLKFGTGPSDGTRSTLATAHGGPTESAPDGSWERMPSTNPIQACAIMRSRRRPLRRQSSNHRVTIARATRGSDMPAQSREHAEPGRRIVRGQRGALCPAPSPVETTRPLRWLILEPSARLRGRIRSEVRNHGCDGMDFESGRRRPQRVSIRTGCARPRAHRCSTTAADPDPDLGAPDPRSTTGPSNKLLSRPRYRCRKRKGPDPDVRSRRFPDRDV